MPDEGKLLWWIASRRQPPHSPAESKKVRLAWQACIIHATGGREGVFRDGPIRFARLTRERREVSQRL